LRGDLDALTAIGSERRLFVAERATEAVGARRAPSLNRPTLICRISIDPRDRDRALRYDFVKDYLYKPLQKEHLVAVANEAKVAAG